MDTNAEAFINHEWTRMKWRFGTTNEHEWTRMNVARAFQPEICPRRPDCLEIDAAGRWGWGRLVSREDAKENANGRGDGSDVLSGSPFHFLESTFYGMDAMTPSPPTPLPRFTGARGGLPQ